MKYGSLAMVVSRGSNVASQVDDSSVGASSKLAKSLFSDMITVYPNVDEYASIRKADEGSWFITALCKVFDNRVYTNTLDIKELLDKVHVNR